VTTKLEEAFISQLASETGGAYYPASTSEIEVEKIYRDIAKLEKSEIRIISSQNLRIAINGF